MKKLMILLAVAMMCSIAMAQTETTRTIHGAVIDKNGNPLPGAVVSATYGAETTFVNADGTFELEIPMWLKSVTASYAGYKNKKMKPRFDQDMIFRLKKDKKRYGFLNIYGGPFFDKYYEFNGINGTAIGLMGGMLSNVGFYVKAGANVNWECIGGELIAGATKRIYKNIYAYLGIGFGTIDDGFDLYPGMAFDGGFIFNVCSHFDISVGYTHICDFEGYWNYAPNLSFGYVF